jgi:hypothetical protein
MHTEFWLRYLKATSHFEKPCLHRRNKLNSVVLVRKRTIPTVHRRIILKKYDNKLDRRVKWIHLAQDKRQCSPIVKAVIKL